MSSKSDTSRNTGIIIGQVASGNTIKTQENSSPKPALRIIDAIVLVTGIVIGAGIFRSPSVVAANAPDWYWFLGMWVLGGCISLIGALCYAELCTAFPSAGGDYHFLKKAFGKKFSFLFAWARITVIQTGSIALLAFIVGDYTSQLFPLGSFSSALYAAGVVVLLTLINILGIQFGTGIQKFLSVLQFIGIGFLIVTGFTLSPDTATVVQATAPASNPTLSLALIFVLLTFGGWNEAAYISAEMRSGSRKMSLVLVLSILIITIVYLLLNASFVNVLGLQGLAASKAVGIDMMRATTGEAGVFLMGMMVSLFALTSINTTIFTGARSNYALGKDFPLLAFLGKWNGARSAPVNALLLQGFIAIALILFGAFMRDGFEAMVDFTAPVFWFFFLCTGIALMVLRIKEPGTPRPFKVPFYPITPVIFIGICGYLLYSSLSVTGKGALVGVGLLLAGLIFYFIFRRKSGRPPDLR